MIKIKIHPKQRQPSDVPERRLLAAALVLVIQDYLYLGRYCSEADQASAEQFIRSADGLGLIASMVNRSDRQTKRTLRRLKYQAARARKN